jgi:translin
MRSDLGVDLSSVEAWARRDLDQRNAAREAALTRSRELIRACATTIRSVHRHEWDNAQQLVQRAGELFRALMDETRRYPDIYWAGYVQDAQKEYVEALATLALTRGEPLPDPEALGVAPAPFLNGLAEAVGELRRFLLDQLRRGNTELGEPLLAAMDDIYDLLVTLDYPDALTGGLRRSTDVTRGILEKTRGDLTFALRQDALTRSLGLEKVS